MLDVSIFFFSLDVSEKNIELDPLWSSSMKHVHIRHEYIDLTMLKKSRARVRIYNIVPVFKFAG